MWGIDRSLCWVLACLDSLLVVGTFLGRVAFQRKENDEGSLGLLKETERRKIPEWPLPRHQQL